MYALNSRVQPTNDTFIQLKIQFQIKWEINAFFHPGDIDSEVKNDISYPWTNVILVVSNNWIQWKFCNVYVKMQLQFDFLLIL